MWALTENAYVMICICHKQMAGTVLLKANAAAENVNLVMYGVHSLAGQLDIVF